MPAGEEPAGHPGKDRPTLITLTEPDGQRLSLDPDLIEQAEEDDGTVLTLRDGTTYTVTESLCELTELVKHHLASVLIKGIEYRRAAVPELSLCLQARRRHSHQN